MRERYRVKLQMKFASILLLAILLTSCSESADDTYIKGYEEGIEEVCFEVKRINEDLYDRLRNDEICF